MKRTLIATALVILAMPAYADSCDDAIARTQSRAEGLNHSFDATVRTLERIDDRRNTTDEEINDAYARAAEHGDSRKLAFELSNIAQKYRGLLTDMFLFIHDRNQIWERRVELDRYLFRVCVD